MVLCQKSSHRFKQKNTAAGQEMRRLPLMRESAPCDRFKIEPLAHDLEMWSAKTARSIWRSDLETKRMLPMAGSVVNIYGCLIRENGA
jgi:hypothetical protein